MSALTTFIFVAWGLFWVYWLISAAGAKQGSRTRRSRPVELLIVAVAALLLRTVRTHSLGVHDPVVRAIGVALFVAGLGLAVWARIHLGANWGMPMTQKDEPELVTSGPYRVVRHPIYSGMLLAMLGTALATELYLLAVLAIMGTYFVYSARVEEEQMTAAFPAVYPGYRARTKMLIPFVL